MIHFYNVTVRYRHGFAVRNLNFSIDNGEFVFITGPTGAGKTTILKLIYMDEVPASGRIVVSDFDSTSIKRRDIPFLRRKVGMIFQDFKLLNDRTVYENIAFALQVIGEKKREIKRKVLKSLAEVGLSHKRDLYPPKLSGGEQQRVSIARALVKEPFVLLADEPTGNLDPDVSSDIMDLLMRINEKGTAVVMATHDYRLIESLSYRVIRLKDGEIV
jgi:cell division transport system ATP-binding protein